MFDLIDKDDCNTSSDFVRRCVRDLSAEAVTEWLIQGHGLKESSKETIISNLREQFRMHRLQGRLDRVNLEELTHDLQNYNIPVLTLQTPKKDGEAVTFTEFDSFFDALIQECRGMRDTKGKEYAHSDSRFANFDRAAERLGISRQMVANVYLHKHLDAIDSYILHKETYSGENIRGRIVDAITYLTLIAGMLDEDLDKSSLSKATYKGYNTCNACYPGSCYHCILPDKHIDTHIARVPDDPQPLVF